MFAFTIGGLSLIGVPLTAGFISKWYLALGALDAGMWWLLGLILLASMLAVVYVFRVIETAYFREPNFSEDITEAPFSLLFPTLVLIAATIFFGIWTEPMLGAARQSAEMFTFTGGAL